MALNGQQQVRDVVVVAASAGGFPSVAAIASAFPADLPAGIVVVLHRGAQQGVPLAELLARRSHLGVVEPPNGTPFEHGRIYVAPSDQHLVVHEGCFFRSRGPKEHFTRPAADPLFRSAAKEFGPRVLGVVLSGYGADGAEGARAVTAAGGIALAQDLREASVPDMPRNALGHVSAVLPLGGLLEAIAVFARGAALDVEGDASEGPSSGRRPRGHARPPWATPPVGIAQVVLFCY
jgi:two-component system chemotaxis response regulator CheB